MDYKVGDILADSDSENILLLEENTNEYGDWLILILNGPFAGSKEELEHRELGIYYSKIA